MAKATPKPGRPKASGKRDEYAVFKWVVFFLFVCLCIAAAGYVLRSGDTTPQQVVWLVILAYPLPAAFFLWHLLGRSDASLDIHAEGEPQPGAKGKADLKAAGPVVVWLIMATAAWLLSPPTSGPITIRAMSPTGLVKSQITVRINPQGKDYSVEIHDGSQTIDGIPRSLRHLEILDVQCFDYQHDLGQLPFLAPITNRTVTLKMKSINQDCSHPSIEELKKQLVASSYPGPDKAMELAPDGKEVTLTLRNETSDKLNVIGVQCRKISEATTRLPQSQDDLAYVDLAIFSKGMAPEELTYHKFDEPTRGDGWYCVHACVKKPTGPQYVYLGIFNFYETKNPKLVILPPANPMQRLVDFSFQK